MSDTPRTDEFISDNVIGCAQGDYPIDAALKLMGQLEAELKVARSVIEASRKIRHWHCRGDGMIVSAESVRNLWLHLDSYDEKYNSIQIEEFLKDE